MYSGTSTINCTKIKYQLYIVLTPFLTQDTCQIWEDLCDSYSYADMVLFWIENISNNIPHFQTLMELTFIIMIKRAITQLSTTIVTLFSVAGTSCYKLIILQVGTSKADDVTYLNGVEFRDKTWKVHFPDTANKYIPL